MAISTELYRAFYGVGLHLSFSRAAKEAGVSQSAISQSVKQLEKELQMTLFERTTKSVAFTPEGRELFEAVAKAFSALDNGVAQLQERIKHDQSCLSLAATDTLCRHFLLPYFKRWQEEENEIGLQITNRPSPVCVQWVEEKKAQLAVINLHEELLQKPHLEIFELGTSQDILVAGPAYADSGVWTQDRLAQAPLLMLEKGAASRNFFESLLKGESIQASFELGSLDVLVDLLEINMGISLVPEMIVQKQLRFQKLIKLETDIIIPARKIGLVRSRLQPLSKGAQKFIDLLKK